MDFDVVDLDHIAIRVSDIESSLEFYRDILGMEVRDKKRYDDGVVPYIAVKSGGRHIHLVPTNEEINVGCEHICILIRSSDMDTKKEAEKLIDYLEKEDVEVEESEPKKRYGAYGRDWALYIRDPDDRRVELKLH